jgi:hypothetical protein
LNQLHQLLLQHQHSQQHLARSLTNFPAADLLLLLLLPWPLLLPPAVAAA